MSSIPGGGSNIFIATNQRQFWTLTIGVANWPGNVLIEAQPTGPGPSLTCTQPTARLSGEFYAFDFSVFNSGASGLYNVQSSLN